MSTPRQTRFPPGLVGFLAGAVILQPSWGCGFGPGAGDERHVTVGGMVEGIVRGGGVGGARAGPPDMSEGAGGGADAGTVEHANDARVPDPTVGAGTGFPNTSPHVRTREPGNPDDANGFDGGEEADPDLGADSGPDGGTEDAAASGCLPEADLDLCARLIAGCGLVTAVDNCGNLRTVDCGSCSAFANSYCDNGICRCRKNSCESLAVECGSGHDDGCGGNVNCSGCSGCKNVCLGGRCVAALHHTSTCYSGDVYWFDSCGVREDVKTRCDNPLVCAGGDCCMPDCSGRCGGPDGCGGACPDNCTSPQTCGGGGTADLCGCMGESVSAICARVLAGCGSVSVEDNCATVRAVDCGSCTAFANSYCDNGVCNCAKHTCGSLDAECGEGRNDGCGGTVDCPGCSGCKNVCLGGRCAATSQATSACDSGDVYWFDSCGIREDVKTRCDSPLVCAGADCCLPDCSGRCGGPDGCGSTCPDNCTSPQTCGGGGTREVCGSLADWIRGGWLQALPEDGPAMADVVISRNTPGCRYFQTPEDLDEWIVSTRSLGVQTLRLDFDRPALTCDFQRTIGHDGYSIELLRVEIFEGIQVPVNVYVPADTGGGTVPLVVTPPGCGSATWSEEVQYLAANLALMGMIVAVPEGYCGNGERDQGGYHVNPGPFTGYAREMISLRGPVGMELQELVSIVTWALERYPAIDPERIGAAGYSHGGQLALYLAQFDRRIASVSVPATHVGDPCGDFRLNSDIWIEDWFPDFVWSPPLELPILPVNHRVAMVYPRYLHTTAGYLDWGANPSFMDHVMEYARETFALGGVEDRVLYRTDDGGHNYGSSRRRDTYEWFAHTLLGEPMAPREEREVLLHTMDDLWIDVSGSTDLGTELAETGDLQMQSRFPEGRAAASRAEMAAAVGALFGESSAGPVSSEPVWSAGFGDVGVQAFRVRAQAYDFPAFVFENSAAEVDARLIFLPEVGTFAELEKIVSLLGERRTVVSIDYLGIGEMKSGRLLPNTVAGYFMPNNPSLPQMNTGALRDYLAGMDYRAAEVYGSGWASSLYAALLKYLEPDRVSRVRLSGVPESELGFVGSARRIPDLILWNGLFARLTVAELAAACDPGEVVWVK